jgi:hypothetical protein
MEFKEPKIEDMRDKMVKLIDLCEGAKLEAKDPVLIFAFAALAGSLASLTRVSPRQEPEEILAAFKSMATILMGSIALGLTMSPAGTRMGPEGVEQFLRWSMEAIQANERPKGAKTKTFGLLEDDF